jgi:hypothetical protein
MNIIKSLRAGPEDFLFSFDFASLFIMVPLGEFFCLLSRQIVATLLVFTVMF